MAINQMENTNQVQLSPEIKPGVITPVKLEEGAIDMNFIEKSESIQTGCVVGDHQYEIMDLSVSGELTDVSLRCKFCGQKDSRQARLNVNNLIDPKLPADKQPTTPVIPIVKSIKPQSVPTIDPRVEAFKVAREQEQQVDNFWDSIKRS